MNQGQRFGGEPLAVNVMSFPPCVVGQWSGAAPATVRETALEAISELLARPAERLVLDFSRLMEVSDPVVQVMARAVSEAQRVGRNVCLVRCSEELFRRLQRAGAAGSITHVGSLLAATHGLAGVPTNTVELSLRSSCEMLSRLRTVVSALSHEAGLHDTDELELKLAVTEAAANAIKHGSPEGVRNHVQVSFHLDPSLLIVDIADQGPGFDPNNTDVPPPGEADHGLGLLMMQRTMDRVEFYRDERGMLVRLTKYLGQGAREWVQ